MTVKKPEPKHVTPTDQRLAQQKDSLAYEAAGGELVHPGGATKWIANGRPAAPKAEKLSPLLSEEDKAALREIGADQMAEFEASEAAAVHATRNLPTDTAEVGRRLNAPIIIESPHRRDGDAWTCEICGSVGLTEAQCPIDGKTKP